MTFAKLRRSCKLRGASPRVGFGVPLLKSLLRVASLRVAIACSLILQVSRISAMSTTGVAEALPHLSNPLYPIYEVSQLRPEQASL
ncbi:hypothetical protein [Nostoc sp.]|uniref:hypothetical protein n=1 Tax=Nostoc sp. TaxID=1180 RepID=UPI002FF822D7